MADNPINRRKSFNKVLTSSAAVFSNPFLYNSNALIEDTNNFDENPMNEEVNNNPWIVNLPLERCGGGGNCVRFTLSGIPEDKEGIIPRRVYRVIVDTGSPYIVLADTDFAVTNSLRPNESSKRFFWDNANTLFVNLLDELGVLSLFEDILFIEEEEETPFLFESSTFPPTEEIYGSQPGTIMWKNSPIQFRDNNIVPSSQQFPRATITLGILDSNLSKESGGSLLGLVKNSNPSSTKIQRRPTFFEQIRLKSSSSLSSSPSRSPSYTSSPSLEEQHTEMEREITSFQIDSPNGQLAFLARNPNANKKEQISQSLISHGDDNILPLVDLRPLGDFVEHYACRCKEILFDGGHISITSQTLANQIAKQTGEEKNIRDIVAVFDTGLTGCLMTQALWDAIVDTQHIDPKALTSLEVTFDTIDYGYDKPNTGKDHTKQFTIASGMDISPYFYVSPISLDWFDDDINSPHVIVLGQAFLSQGILTIDMEERLLSYTISRV